MLEHFGCEVTESKNTQHRMRIALGDEAFYIDRVRRVSRTERPMKSTLNETLTALS